MYLNSKVNSTKNNNNNYNSTTEILMGNNNDNHDNNMNHPTTPYYCTVTDDGIVVASHNNIQHSIRTKKTCENIQYMIYLVFGVITINIMFLLYTDTSMVNVGIACGIMIVLVGIVAAVMWIMNVHCIPFTVNDNTSDNPEITATSTSSITSSSPHEIRKSKAWAKLIFMSNIFSVSIVFQLILVLLEKHDLVLVVTILGYTIIIFGIIATVMWFLEVYFVSIHHFMLGEEGTTMNDVSNINNPLYIRKKQTCDTIQSMYTLFQTIIFYNLLFAFYQSVFNGKDISNFSIAFLIFSILFIIFAIVFWIISVHCLHLDHTLIDTHNNSNEAVDQGINSSPLSIRKMMVWNKIKNMIYLIVGMVVFQIILALLDGKDIATIGMTCGVFTIVFGIIAAVIWIIAVYCIPISSS